MKRSLILAAMLSAVVGLIAVLPVHADATLSGKVWHDLDGDGRLGAAEPGVVGMTVRLTGDKGLSRTATTDATGKYEFPNLPTDTYHILLPISEGGQPWISTFPARVLDRSLQVNINIASTAQSVDFGLIEVASQFARFSGVVTVHGQPGLGRQVEAVVNGRVCSITSGTAPAGSGSNFFTIAVVNNTFLPGCGTPGAPVSFRVNGLPANETATWNVQQRSINLSVGAPGQAPAPAPVPTAVPQPTPAPAVPPALPPAPAPAPQTIAPRPVTNPGTIVPPNTGDAGLR